MKKKSRVLFSVLLIFALSLFLFACSSNDEAGLSTGGDAADYDRAEEYSPSESEGYSDDAAGEPQGPTSNSVSGDKIIYRQNLTMETDNLQETIDKMEQDLDRYGGHIHRYQVISEQDETPRGSFTLRVPSESLKEFVDSMRDYGVFTQEVLESDDVSETYYDIEANLRNQTIQERRLLDLLEDAESLSDILTLESELSRIRREIERLSGHINRLDDQVRYSTVYLSVVEVEDGEMDDDNFSEAFFRNLKASFGKFQGALESMLLWIAGYFPFIILAGILLAVISKFYPRLFKRFKRKESPENRE